jgi:hypothetical protein
VLFPLLLQADFPQLRELSELRRDPHLLGWVRGLYQQNPPLSNGTREDRTQPQSPGAYL